jgi:cytochrome c biogenesis factor
VVFQGGTRDGRKAVVQVFYNPLVMWVWIGGIILVAGTLIALLPNKKAIIRRRPEIDSKEEAKELEAKA